MAQHNLGVMYDKGEGVPEDYVKAYAWFNLAAAQGQEDAVKAKDSLRERMTAEQVAEAQKLAGELFNRIESSPPQVKPPQRVRVPESVQCANLIIQLRPRYPAMATRARIQGAVILEAIISAQGSVENLRVVTGHPLLIQSTLDAVNQWRYKRTVLNGVPVEVITRITVRYRLAQRVGWHDCPPQTNLIESSKSQ